MFMKRPPSLITLAMDIVLALFLFVVISLFTTMPVAYAEDMYALEVGGGMTATINDDKDVLRLGTYTYEFWLKDLDGPTGSWRRIFVKGGGDVNTGRGPNVGLFPSEPALQYSNSTGAGQLAIRTSGEIPVNEWIHIALVLTSLNGEQMIYLDGAQDAVGNVSGLTQDTQEPVLTIGNAAHVILDDFRVWNYARTDIEIQQDMNQELMGTENGLVGYWKFNEGQGTTAFDSSPSGNNGVITGALWTVDVAPIAIAVPIGSAYDPTPADGTVDVPRDEVVLSWEPGIYADKHDVYFGTDFNDVNNATTGSPTYQGRQSETTYTPDHLDFGQTYYWRIDAVNAPPESTIFTGDVWSFTVETFALPIPSADITVTASSSNRAEEGPENTINGSGLDDNGLHSVDQTDMWLSNGLDPNATWIQYEFDKAYKLYQMSVWNYNTTVEPLVGFGIKEATIEYSINGIDWAVLGTTHEFAKGPGSPGYALNNIIDFGGVTARYVKITAVSNWGGILNQYGLSEVRFSSVPVLAREPDPVTGAVDVDVNSTLAWRAGREADKHNVYLSTDEQAVVDGNAPVVTVTEPSYSASLDLASTYFWRVDEVNDAETPTTWSSDIWNFSTREYLVVDDFESYNDIEAGQKGSNLIYMTWADGFDNPSTNGSTIGYTVPFAPTMETSVVYDGSQSVPLFYNNTVASYSEVTANVANLQAGQDWSKYGIKGLTLRFYGDPNNSVNDRMYVKINGSKVAYDGDVENFKRTGWQMWYVDLTSLGVNLTSVAELSIGFERIGAFGGQGVVLLDGIRLYAYDRQLVIPAKTEPDNTGLVVHWSLDEGSGTTVRDTSGNGYDAELTGDPQWVQGHDGTALNFDGIDDSVIARLAAEETWQAYTVTIWAKADVLWQAVNSCVFANHTTYSVDTPSMQISFDSMNNYQFHGSVDEIIGPATTDWVHLAVTSDGPTVTVYYNGILVSSVATGAGDPVFNKFAIGTNRAEDTFFNGALDDLRVYNRVLTPEEIAWLSGSTTTYDKPF